MTAHSLHRLPGGTTVHRWRTDRAKAAVLLQHGFAEYAERYVVQHARLVPRLVEAGYEVWALDLWGHGRSPGRRGVASIRLAVRDHLEARSLAAASGLPVLLVGHSLGGLVSAASVAREPSGAAGAILLAPALERPAPTGLRRALGAVAAVAPSVPIPRRRRPLSELSRLPEVGERAAADPRMHDGQVSLLLAATALDAAATVWAALPTWHTPTLVLHGTADTYTDPSGSSDLVTRVGRSDVRLEVVDGGRHELLNDLGAEATLGLVVEWLDGAVGP